MLATKITTHIQDALARLMQQYKDQPNLANLLTILTEQIQDLEDSTFEIDQKRQLFDGTTYQATGAQLDGIGALVGIARNGLPDAEYLLFILGTIAENTSDTTIAVILNVIQFLFQPSGLILKELFPAGLGFSFTSTPIDPSFFLICANIVQNSLGAGIGLDYIVQYSDTNPFAFIDLNSIIPDFPNGNGFDDLLSPGQGGDFATLIYNNPMA